MTVKVDDDYIGIAYVESCHRARGKDDGGFNRCKREQQRPKSERKPLPHGCEFAARAENRGSRDNHRKRCEDGTRLRRRKNA